MAGGMGMDGAPKLCATRDVGAAVPKSPW
jgi:transposase